MGQAEGGGGEGEETTTNFRECKILDGRDCAYKSEKVRV